MTAAIFTKYLPYTDTKQSRVKAYVKHSQVKETVTLNYDHGKTTDDNHNEAARQLATKLKWHGKWCRGDLPDGMVYVRVISDFDVPFTVAAE